MPDLYVDGSRSVNGSGTRSSPYNVLSAAMSFVVDDFIGSGGGYRIYVRSADDYGREILYHTQDGTSGAILQLPANDDGTPSCIEPYSVTPGDRLGRIVLDCSPESLPYGVIGAEDILWADGMWIIWNLEVRGSTDRAVDLLMYQGSVSSLVLHNPLITACAAGIVVNKAWDVVGAHLVACGGGTDYGIHAGMVVGARVLSPSMKVAIYADRGASRCLVANHCGVGASSAEAIGIYSPITFGCTITRKASAQSDPYAVGIMAGPLSITTGPNYAVSVEDCIVDGYYLGIRGRSVASARVVNTCIHDAVVRTLAGTGGTITELNPIASDPGFEDGANGKLAVDSGTECATASSMGGAIGTSGTWGRPARFIDLANRRSMRP